MALTAFSLQVWNGQTRPCFFRPPCPPSHTHTQHNILRIKLKFSHLDILNLGLYRENVYFYIYNPSQWKIKAWKFLASSLWGVLISQSFFYMWDSRRRHLYVPKAFWNKAISRPEMCLKTIIFLHVAHFFGMCGMAEKLSTPPSLCT